MAAIDQTERTVVRQLDVRSVARVTLALSLTLSAVILVGLLALWLLGMASGAMTGVERFFVSLGYDSFKLSLIGILPFYIVAAVVASGIMTGIAVILTILYNTLADLVGGVEIVTRDR